MAGAESTLGPTCRSLSHTGIRFQTLALALSEALEYAGIRFGYSSLREALSTLAYTTWIQALALRKAPSGILLLERLRGPPWRTTETGYWLLAPLSWHWRDQIHAQRFHLPNK